ncbi:unnamed protein product [Cyclocybe aegerita]|uniref:G-patch domain-containing protein n=1 Tax=Cyclocybe aegerita TaxID=1973307 RepID=A0A8S0W6I3_CYCAE|nr:unnamed protein product [Cyclocybe aegerita]
MSSKVSFTVRRPTPVSRATSSGPDSDAGSSFRVPSIPRHLTNTNGDSALGSPLARSETSSPHPDAQYDSSDEDSVVEDELVTGFDKFGVQRCVSSVPRRLQLFQLTKAPHDGRKNGIVKKVDKPLVIPALKNKDWRALARKRRSAAQYVPTSAAAPTGADGSVGGLGTRDTINSGPVLSGLQLKKKLVKTEEDDTVMQEATEDVEMQAVEEETEDQKALRAILAAASGETQQEGPVIDIIPTPISEADALKQDVDELPDVATLEDYARVPVSQFGAALLRGMGWKEGTAASRKPGKGIVEPYLPTARPALLGIGAKEQEIYDDGSKKGKGNRRANQIYVPVSRQERPDSRNGSSREGRDRSRSPRRSAVSSRRASPDRHGGRSERNGDGSRYDSDRDRERDRERRRDGDRDRNRDQDTSRRRDEKRRDDDRDRHRDDKRRGDRDERQRPDRKRDRS